MKESLLNKVDAAKLDALNDALVDAMQDMKEDADGASVCGMKATPPCWS